MSEFTSTLSTVRVARSGPSPRSLHRRKSALVIAAVGFVGCGRPDVTTGVSEDASRGSPLIDGGILDAPAPDEHDATAAAEDVEEVRADAWLVDECNSADDDGDGLVDEAPTGCGEVPNAGEGLCLAGSCVCRDPASTPHAGARGDCNADSADGCETALDTESDCGACGVQCDVVSRCVDDPDRGLVCRTAGILDLSVAEPMGEITCVVTLGQPAPLPRAEHR